MEEEKVEVVAGVNLPMLIKISSLRAECNIKELINYLRSLAENI